jgi:3-oxoacyl-[acyl-carrier-protein] synthase II
MAILSGAAGAEPATSEEGSFLSSFGDIPIRATASSVGYGFESQFSMNVALAALATSKGTLFPSANVIGGERETARPVDTVLVTGTGHWRGEGLALVEKARGG